MNDDFRPVLYVNAKCPFCFKVRLYLLEAGLLDTVDIRECEPDTPDEDAMRAELAPHIDKVSFPVLQTGPDTYMKESDDIISWFASQSSVNPDSLPTFQTYVAGPFQSILSLYSENRDLKKRLA